MKSLYWLFCCFFIQYGFFRKWSVRNDVGNWSTVTRFLFCVRKLRKRVCVNFWRVWWRFDKLCSRVSISCGVVFCLEFARVWIMNGVVEWISGWFVFNEFFGFFFLFQVIEWFFFGRTNVRVLLILDLVWKMRFSNSCRSISLKFFLQVLPKKYENRHQLPPIS